MVKGKPRLCVKCFNRSSKLLRDQRAAGYLSGKIRLLRKGCNYESEVDASVKPLMIVVVGGIRLAMYLPLFRIFELIE